MMKRIPTSTLVGVIWLAMSLSCTSSLQPATPTPTPTPTPIDILAINKPRLISAIKLADQAEIDAERNLNPSPLHNVYQGEALKTELAQIQSLKDDGVFIDSSLDDQQFESFNVSPDGKRAEVRVIETWSYTQYLASTRQCLNKSLKQVVPQTIYLEHGENGWMVDAVNHDKTTGAEPIPCENTSTYLLKIQNDSRYNIHHLYMSPNETEIWGPDQLGTTILKTGKNFTLTDIAPGKYDVKFVDEDGDECVVKIAVLDNTSWTLTNDWLTKCEGYR